MCLGTGEQTVSFPEAPNVQDDPSRSVPYVVFLDGIMREFFGRSPTGYFVFIQLQLWERSGPQSYLLFSSLASDNTNNSNGNAPFEQALSILTPIIYRWISVTRLIEYRLRNDAVFHFP
jgi:hypothetical protein